MGRQVMRRSGVVREQCCEARIAGCVELVLRQGSLAQVLPQWVLIGLVGVALTVVGVTWEQRLQEIRKVSAYVRSLR